MLNTEYLLLDCLAVIFRLINHTWNNITSGLWPGSEKVQRGRAINLRGYLTVVAAATKSERKPFITSCLGQRGVACA